MSNADFGQIAGSVPYWDLRDGTGDLWDLLMLGDSVWPGITRIKTQGRSKKVDTKKSKGSDGASLTDEGLEPTKVTIQTKIWTAEQFAAMQRMLPSVTPSKLGADRAAVPALHPQLQLLGITYLYVTRQGTLEVDEMGLGTIELDAIEWTPKAQPTPAQGIGQPAPNGPSYHFDPGNESTFPTVPSPEEPSNLDESLSGYAD